MKSIILTILGSIAVVAGAQDRPFMDAVVRDKDGTRLMRCEDVERIRMDDYSDGSKRLVVIVYIEDCEFTLPGAPPVLPDPD